MKRRGFLAATAKVAALFTGGLAAAKAVVPDSQIFPAGVDRLHRRTASGCVFYDGSNWDRGTKTTSSSVTIVMEG